MYRNIYENGWHLKTDYGDFLWTESENRENKKKTRGLFYIESRSLFITGKFILCADNVKLGVTNGSIPQLFEDITSFEVKFQKLMERQVVLLDKQMELLTSTSFA